MRYFVRCFVSGADYGVAQPRYAVSGSGCEHTARHPTQPPIRPSSLIISFSWRIRDFEYDELWIFGLSSSAFPSLLLTVHANVPPNSPKTTASMVTPVFCKCTQSFQFLCASQRSLIRSAQWHGLRETAGSGSRKGVTRFKNVHIRNTKRRIPSLNPLGRLFEQLSPRKP